MLLDSTRNIVGQPNVKLSFAILQDVDAISCRHAARRNWLRGRDLNPRPSGYEPDELPGCSTPRLYLCRRSRRKQIEKAVVGQDDLRNRKIWLQRPTFMRSSLTPVLVRKGYQKA